jgi:hypothetical protein
VGAQGIPLVEVIPEKGADGGRYYVWPGNQSGNVTLVPGDSGHESDIGFSLSRKFNGKQQDSGRKQVFEQFDHGQVLNGLKDLFIAGF